jgi:hypothetical protein
LWRRSFADEPPAARDVWVRWQGTFVVPPGTQDTTTLVARATDGTGANQPEPFVLPQPDGSSGWCSIDVRAAG